MNIDNFKNKISQICKKWYFKIPIIGKVIRRKLQGKITNKSIELINEYIAELHREEFNNKSKEEQFKVVEYIVNLVADDIGLYTRPNWSKICKEVKHEFE